MRVNSTCLYCGKVRLIQPSRAKLRKFCSYQCSVDYGKRSCIPVIGPSIGYIPLASGNYSRVSAEDAPHLGLLMWYEQKQGNTSYAHSHVAIGNNKNAHISIHRAILGMGSDAVDHIDGDGLNNERRNLRFATRHENMRNSRMKKTNKVGIKGVIYNAKLGKWTSSIRISGKQRFLGVFPSPEEAGEAYKIASQTHFGEFSRL